MDSKQPSEIIDVGNVTSYIDFAVQYFTYYSYNVRSYDAAGNYSPWSNKVLAYIPLPFGQPNPEYLELENGNTLLAESGLSFLKTQNINLKNAKKKIEAQPARSKRAKRSSQYS